MSILDVTVNIKIPEVIGRMGTWFPCLYIIDDSLEADAYDEYRNLSEMADTDSEATTYADTSPIYLAASKLFAQKDAPEKIAVLAQPAFSAQTMGVYITKGWRQLVLVGNHTNTAPIAEYINGTDKLVFVNVSSMDSLTSLAASVASYDRTILVYHTTEPYAAAAVVGATAGLSAGSFTYKNIKINGITPMGLSSSELEAVHTLKAITIVEKVGDIVTSDGITASGNFIDILDSQDYIIQNITYKVQKVLTNNPKVPYTNAGIGMLETATLEALKDAYNQGMIADTENGIPAYNTSFALRNETTETDRASRIYPYGTFSFTLTGAVHEVIINGTVTV